MDGSNLPEPIRILSDLHLGHPACALKDVREIRPLLAGARTVIFNGDTGEVRAKSFRERAAEDQDRLTKMLAELGVEQTFYVTGNHDPRISNIHHIDLCQGRLLVTHGDFLFRYISPWSKKLRHCRPRIDAILEKCDHSRYANDLDYRLDITRQCCDVLEVSSTPSPSTLSGLIRYVGDEVWPPTRLLSILSVWLKTPQLMASALETYRPEAQAVVFGHIHYPKVWTRRGRLLINTGGFLNLVKAKVAEIHNQHLRVHRVIHQSGQCRLQSEPRHSELDLSQPTEQSTRNRHC